MVSGFVFGSSFGGAEVGLALNPISSYSELGNCKVVQLRRAKFNSDCESDCEHSSSGATCISGWHGAVVAKPQVWTDGKRSESLMIPWKIYLLTTIPKGITILIDLATGRSDAGVGIAMLKGNRHLNGESLTFG